MSMTKKTRLLAIVLALFMLCSTFLFSCSSETTETSTLPQQTQGITDTAEEFDKEIIDLQGRTFLFYTKDVATSASHLAFNEVYATAEQVGKDKVSEAVFRRNSLLEKDFNCKIEQQLTSSPVADTTDAIRSGDYICDFIFIGAKDMKTLAKSNLLVDMTQLESMDLSKSWYDQNAIDGLNIAGKVFFVTGDGCTIDERRMEGMYFNIEMIEALDDSINLYQEVRDGKWTIDRMLELVNATAEDMDGDDMITYESSKDIYGFMAGTSCDWCFVAGCGVTLSNYNSSGDIEIPYEPKRELIDVWNELKPLLTNPSRHVSATGTLFRSGRVAFYCCNIGSMLNWSQSQFKLGVIPYPKRNVEQQEYYITGLFTLGGFGIPTTVGAFPEDNWQAAGFDSAEERNAYFLEAFFYYSQTTLKPAFFNQVLEKQIVSDEDSIEMLEIALKNKIYDPVVGYNFGGMENCFKECGNNGTAKLGSDVNYGKFTSEYKTKCIKARTEVENYLKFISEGEI